MQNKEKNGDYKGRNVLSIGACGAIPPLVSLLLNGSCRGKKDALTTLYKLCTLQQNKERAVTAGAVKPLVDLVAEEGTGMAEKAMVVLSSLAAIDEGKEAIVAIPPLVGLSQSGAVSVRAKRKAERLLGYLREPRNEGCSSSP